MQTKCPGWRAALLFVVFSVGAWSGVAFGNVDKHATSTFSPLPYPKALQPQVEFWTDIFATYSEYQVVIHDAVYLDKVYAVLDFRPLLETHSKAKVRQLKSKRTRQELRKIRAALRKLHTHGAKGRTLSARERKIRALFRDVKERHKFRKAAAKKRLRAQSGIRERFRRSLRLSGRYLPRMEKIFRQKGLPVVLTRLPLIESSFNIEAYSKAGAAGVWQFMPATGRLFLTINHEVDERLDPIIATRAAADLLKANYDKLRTWPLAVTAYNHGRAGMARAVRKVGTRDIATIIRRYKSRTFGFASRNFYAELLAAIEVEKNSEKYFGPITRDPLLRYDEVEVKHFVSLENLAWAADTSTERLVALNPSFRSLIRNGELHVPRRHRLRIPAGTRKDFDRRYAALSPQAKADRQVATLTHTVRRGRDAWQYCATLQDERSDPATPERTQKCALYSHWPRASRLPEREGPPSGSPTCPSGAGCLGRRDTYRASGRIARQDRPTLQHNRGGAPTAQRHQKRQADTGRENAAHLG